MICRNKKSRGGAVKLLTLGALALSLLISPPIWAQVAGAKLSGTVTDPTGAVMPDVALSVKNLATGVTTTGKTNAVGFYTVPNLLPGTYEVTSTAPGFKTNVRSGIRLDVGAEKVLNISMDVGATSEVVEVVGGAPAVDLGSSSISAVVHTETIVELPLNGRDWTLLAALQPGVTVITWLTDPAGTGRAARGFGRQMSISGTRPSHTNYRLDGISMVDYSGGAPGSSLGTTMGVEAVGEFSVVTANHAADYGRTSGGVVNAITRSGSNEFHGSLFWFLRDEAFDARNFFVTENPPFHRNQFGASVGGPIKKNKIFFFFDYEGLHQAKGLANVQNTLTENARNGDLYYSSPAAFPSDCVPTGVPNQCHVDVDPLIRPYLDFWPLPNVAQTGPANAAQWNMPLSQRQQMDYQVARIDVVFSEKDKLSGTWQHDTGENSKPDGLNNIITGNTTKRHMVGSEWTHTFGPTLVNSVRGGVHRLVTFSRDALEATNPLAGDTSLGIYPGWTNPSLGTITGLSAVQAGLMGGNIRSWVWHTVQFYDDAFLQKGAHSLKFGFYFERDYTDTNSEQNTEGSFQFGTIYNLLTNRPTNFVVKNPMGVLPLTPFNIRQNIFGVYFQDDWQVRPGLTLNLGLRYETASVPMEIDGRLASLPTLASPADEIRTGSPYFSNPTKFNFEPRVGFAWDPFQTGKTSVRGAFGIFDLLPLEYNFYLPQVDTYPHVFSLSLGSADLPQGSFPTGALDILTAGGVLDLTTVSVDYHDLYPRRNYLMIWNLNIQRELTPSTSVMVGYVGSRGVHMLQRSEDANLVLPTLTAQGYLWPSPRNSGTRINENVGRIYYNAFGGDSSYHGLQVQVSKRMSHGFQVQGSYTWSKNIDNGPSGSSNAGADDSYDNTMRTPLWFCPDCTRGVSDFNIAHTFVANGLWHVPSPKNWGPVASRLLGGWQLGGVVTARSGTPFTPQIGGDPLGVKGRRRDTFPDRLSGAGCHEAVNPGSISPYIKLECFAMPVPSLLLGNAGRNILEGPGFFNVDFSVVKNNSIPRISEAFNVQFRVEFFNLLNRANFATPSGFRIFDRSGNVPANAGDITSTANDSREIQFGLKIIF
jgi:hypothetical protein